MNGRAGSGIILIDPLSYDIDVGLSIARLLGRGHWMEQSGASIWLLVFVAVFAYFFTGFSREEIVGYSAQCSNDETVAPLVLHGKLGMTTKALRQSISNCELYTTSKTVFSVNPTADTVTYRIGDLPILTKWDGCVILDKENWSCPYSDGSGVVGFRDGLRALPENQVEYGTFYQRRWQHFITRVLNTFFGPVSGISILIPDQVTPY